MRQPSMTKKRLTQKDWRLIAEALQMLQNDYPDGECDHPEAGRISELEDYATARGYAPKRHRPKPIDRRIREAVLRVRGAK